MKSNVGFFRKTNTIDGREVEETEAEQRKALRAAPGQ